MLRLKLILLCPFFYFFMKSLLSFIVSVCNAIEFVISFKKEGEKMSFRKMMLSGCVVSLISLSIGGFTTPKILLESQTINEETIQFVPEVEAVSPTLVTISVYVGTAFIGYVIGAMVDGVIINVTGHSLGEHFSHLYTDIKNMIVGKRFTSSVTLNGSGGGTHSGGFHVMPVAEVY